MLIVRRRTLVYLLVSVFVAVAAWRIVPELLPPRLVLHAGAPGHSGGPGYAGALGHPGALGAAGAQGASGAANDAGSPRGAGSPGMPKMPVASAGESGSLGLAETEPGSAPVMAIGGSGGSGVPTGPAATGAGADGADATGEDDAPARGSAREPIRLSWPMLGDITSYYGPRDNEFHTGIDIAAVTGQAVRAALGGTVVEAGWRGGYGLCVVVDHGNGLQTLYAHNSKLEVEIGDQVEPGHLLALAGSTGYSTGPHLHFEILLNGFPVNPLPWLEP